MPISPFGRLRRSSLTQPAAREVVRFAGFLSSWMKLIVLCAFIVTVGMVSPRLTPTEAGLTALVGFGGVGVGVAAFVLVGRRMRQPTGPGGVLRFAGVLQTVLRRLGLPILALGFFLLWTFVYLALWWFDPQDAFSGLPTNADPRFADFFYYSVLTAFISPPGDIIAVSRGVRSATMIEMLTGLSLLATYVSSLIDVPGATATGNATDQSSPDDKEG